MAPEDAIAAGDWARIERLARDAVRTMLGLDIVHLGINSENAEIAMREAEKLSLLLGWPLREDSPKGVFVGGRFEMMKTWFRGTHGHIAIGALDVDRARWHMERSGFAFDELFTGWIREYVGFLAPVFIYPGEDEMRSLAHGALRVLRGEEEALEYS